MFNPETWMVWKEDERKWVKLDWTRDELDWHLTWQESWTLVYRSPVDKDNPTKMVWKEEEKKWEEVPLTPTEIEWLHWHDPTIDHRPSAMPAGYGQLYPLIPGRAYVLPSSPERTRHIFAEEYGDAKFGYAIGLLDENVSYDPAPLIKIVRKMWESTSVTEFESNAIRQSFDFPLPLPSTDSSDLYTQSVHAWAQALTYFNYWDDVAKEIVSKKKTYSNFWAFLRLKFGTSPSDMRQDGYKEVYLCLGRWTVTNYVTPNEEPNRYALTLNYPESGFQDTYNEVDRMAQSVAIGELGTVMNGGRP